MLERHKARRPAAIVLALLISAASARAETPASYESLDSRAFALSSSQSDQDRIEATGLLASVGSAAALDRLLLMLRYDRAPAVRASAARSLGGRGDPSLQGLLEGASKVDPDPAVREAAARASQAMWRRGRRPGLAAGLSLLCPGCGYFHLRQPGRAVAYLASTAALVGGGVLLLGDGKLDLSGDVGPRMTPTTQPLALPLLMAAQNLWFYGVFAAYRDARLARGDLGHSYPVSHEHLTDLMTAPVRPSVLRRPWFWAGLPLAIAAAAGFSALVSPNDVGRGVRSLRDGRGVWFLGRHYGTGAGVALGETYYASLFLPVGVGEEALFRGALQPALADTFGLWPGWGATSLIFGAIHIFNFTDGNGGLATGAKVVPFLTAMGGYLGLTAIKTGYTLETSVALHCWYDFLLGTLGFIADPDHQPFAVRIALPL